MSEPLTSTALGALVLVVLPSTVHCGAPPMSLSVCEHGARAFLLERRKAAADGVEQEELGLVDRRLPECPRARIANTHSASCSTAPRSLRGCELLP